MLVNKFRSLLSVFFILMGTAGAVNNSGRLLSRPIATMVLQGTPVFSVSPSGPVDLGPSAIGVNTPHGFPVSIFISNLGSADLMVAPSFTSSEYGFTAESFFATAVTVLPGRTKRGDIIFMPQAAGPRIAQFISTDNAAGSPHTVPLTGTGVNVAANDFALVLDPAVTLVGVSPGKTASFNVWVLAGPGLPQGPDGTLQCNGGPSGTSCSLATSTFSIDDADGFAQTRQSIAVSVTVPARSASFLRHKVIFWWSMPAVCGVVLAFGRRRGAARFLLISILVVASSFVISCGGSSSAVNNNALTMTASRNGTTHAISVPLNMQ